MFPAHVPESQQSTVAVTVVRRRSGCWTLAPGRALALQPRRRSALTVVRGRIWVTQSGGPGQHVEDRFLAAGECWVAEPGRRVVLEPAGLAPGEEAAFHWDPLPGAVPAEAAWEGGVRQPLRDLARAARDVAGALARLAAGALRWAVLRGGWALARRSA